MRHHAPGGTQPSPNLFNANDFKAIKSLAPYLLAFKGRVFIALLCLIIAKVTNVAVPLALKSIIDGLDPKHQIIMFPIAWIVAYGLLRFSTTLFNELRDGVFAKVTQSAIRRIALTVFKHLHSLNLRFHLERQTGGMSRDIERGTRGIESLMRFTLFSIMPTLVEILLVASILAWKYDVWFALITLITLVVYIGITVVITEWRTHFRRRMNELDSRANARAIDSLINYETVKYFGNEAWETKRYDENLEKWESASVKSQTSLTLLNASQSLIIGLGATILMYRAAQGVYQGHLSIGDLVLINSLLLQLYIPLNFLGVIYREIKQSLADMDRMFRLLSVNAEVKDKDSATELTLNEAPQVTFQEVNFAYDERRPILHQVSFTIDPGKTIAVVGHSGAGKSTLSRLLFRFYDIQGGSIFINHQDIRDVTQQSLRAAIGIVPQDTVLFNDTVFYNIAYGRPDASREEVIAAAKAAHIDGFIESLPEGYESIVGERGLKLSGGEKQRVAIARTLLKRPHVLIFDEATSALDSHSEKEIQQEITALAKSHTTLIIAHRLSTVVHADEIIVMDQGRIIERGRHEDLLAEHGAYRRMWVLQQKEQTKIEA
ncbi:MAG: metal ABC transporter permease [Ferrovum sp. 37-45-19]|nr:MAG: metal ABC transporter permease [Ferrovum sp. 21-44-67]OYV95420.1 MAG: metal ABC transporter permease [Ferrovum sp. 37-45-19]OZB31471.1 MAG: metal ABC transporter permease [Ferrovum sp. 34-44-207]HQT81213.1 ABC transporter ATP-binding protein/permease [Ferrovaceae bacterium]HQU05666.1 ABC transporter ATP-binding protein/permease [Ferrovaceae bacterium]